jgi:DNA-directed RNA polymerase subunit L
MTTIKDVSYDKTLGNSRLEFNVSGSNINYVIINTLRRTILTDIPTYAFTDFKFTKNTSIFHNNFLKNQIRNIPVWGIENNIDIYVKEEKKIEINEDFEDDDNIRLDESTVETNTSSLNQLTMYIDYVNNSNMVYTVTTDDAKFYFGQKLVDNPYKSIQIVKLQPKQEIKLSAITTIGIEKESSIFSPVSVCVYDEIKPNEFKFIIESRNNITEFQILSKAYKNLTKKLNDIVEQVDASLNENETLEGVLHINNEEHTMGNLISHGLQNHKDVQFAGYHMNHPLETVVYVTYKLKKGTIKEILSEVTEKFKDIFKEINKSIANNKLNQ